MVRWLAIALAASAALAGCGGEDEPPAGIPVDEQGDALPTVEGFVVDEAIRPMAGVTVRVLQEDAQAVTDDAGHYALMRPTFVAEQVLVTAFAPGYMPLSHAVQASGHTSSRVDFRLAPDPHQVARVETYQHTGQVPCQVRTGGTQLPCAPPDVSLNGIEMPEMMETWAIETSVNLAGAVLEVHWDAETALAEELHAILRGPVVGCCDMQPMRHDHPVQAEATGPSPLRLDVPADAAGGFPSWSSIWLEVSLPDTQPNGPVSATRAQTFEAYASLFYVDPAPPGYAFA